MGVSPGSDGGSRTRGRKTRVQCDNDRHFLMVICNWQIPFLWGCRFYISSWTISTLRKRIWNPGILPVKPRTSYKKKKLFSMNFMTPRSWRFPLFYFTINCNYKRVILFAVILVPLSHVKARPLSWDSTRHFHDFLTAKAKAWHTSVTRARLFAASLAVLTLAPNLSKTVLVGFSSNGRWRPAINKEFLDPASIARDDSKK